MFDADRFGSGSAEQLGHGAEERKSARTASTRIMLRSSDMVHKNGMTASVMAVCSSYGGSWWRARLVKDWVLAIKVTLRIDPI